MKGSNGNAGDQSSEEFNHAARNQFPEQQNAGNGDKMAHVEEKELRQHLHDFK